MTSGPGETGLNADDRRRDTLAMLHAILKLFLEALRESL